MTFAFLALTGLIVGTVYIIQRVKSGRGLPFFYKPDGAPAKNQTKHVQNKHKNNSTATLPPDNSIRNPNYEDITEA